MSLLAATLLLTAGNACAEAAEPKLQIDPSELPRKENPALSYKDVVDRVAPAVVNIYSTKTIRTRQQPMGFFNDPLFRRFFGMPPGSTVPPERQEQSLGSGVIVTTDGYIVTNSHVVEGADEVRVALPQDQREFDAEIVGTDPQTDIAVLRIDAENLTAATLGDSDKLAVGDVVLAVGNPFNVGQTVTIGIAGALSRGLGIETYEDFIQTDASINPGNSGGPLIDGLGRVIGINTAILSRSGGNQGVGFAVPINLARDVFEQIVKHGKVTRGYLGVVVQPVTAELSQEFGMKEPRGALIADVSPDTPAAEAGLQPGDVVVAFNGTEVRDARHLQLLVAQQRPGAQVELRILREGKEQTVTPTLAEQPRRGLAAGPGGGPGMPGDSGELFAGMEVQDLDPAIRGQIGVPENIQGAVITEVAPGSPGAAAGLQPGDVILGINHQPVRSAEEAMQLSQQVRGDRALLRVWSRGSVAFVVLKRTDTDG